VRMTGVLGVLALSLSALGIYGVSRSRSAGERKNLASGWRLAQLERLWCDRCLR
jgi:hypothetical protein